MKSIFIKTAEFTEWVKTYLSDDDLSVMQKLLLANTEAGTVIPDCGGLRKLRIPDPERGKGKRGGARVVSLHVEETHEIHPISVYGKDQRDDLSAEVRKLYRKSAQMFKEIARHSKR